MEVLLAAEALLAVTSPFAVVDELLSLTPTRKRLYLPPLLHGARSLLVAYFSTEVAQDRLAVSTHVALLATLISLHRRASHTYVSHLVAPRATHIFNLSLSFYIYKRKDIIRNVTNHISVQV